MLLRTQWLQDTYQAEVARSCGPDAVRIAGQIAMDTHPEDVYREAKQVLKSVCMACLSFSGHDYPPPIEEATRGGHIAYLEMLIYSRSHPLRPP